LVPSWLTEALPAGHESLRRRDGVFTLEHEIGHAPVQMGRPGAPRWPGSRPRNHHCRAMTIKQLRAASDDDLIEAHDE